MSEATKKPGIEFYGGYQVYSDSGVDLTTLRENLKRTVEERWENTQKAAVFAEDLRRAVQVSNRGKRLQTAARPFMFEPAKLVRLLLENHVDFVVIGGMAMSAHGSNYITKDLDICYARTPQNIAALTAALASIHPYMRGAPPGLPFRFDAPTVQAGLNFTLTTNWGDLDLLGEVRGIGFYDKVAAQSVEATLYGFSIRVLSVEGLIASKKAAGRGKDRNHIEELEELKGKQDQA